MKDRRYNPARASLARLWTMVWLAVLAFAGTLWVTDAFADDYYGGDNSYYGTRGAWRADMEALERRQTEVMEWQQQHQLQEDIRRNYQENLENNARHRQSLQLDTTGWQ